jgi:hypothetical protein
MAESTVPRTKRDGQIVITDSVRTYTINKEVGDFQWDSPNEAVTAFLDRGQFGSTPDLRLGDDQASTFSFSAYLRDLFSTTYTTLWDLCNKTAGSYVATTWASTLGTASDVTTWTVQYTVDGSPFGEADKTITFAFSVLRASIAESDQSTVSVTGTSYLARPTVA